MVFTYISHNNQPNVGKSTSPMDCMGLSLSLWVVSSNSLPEAFRILWELSAFLQLLVTFIAILTSLYTFFCGFLFSKKKTYQEKKIPWRIHGTGMFPRILADFYGKLVGKYRTPFFPWEIRKWEWHAVNGWDSPSTAPTGRSTPQEPAWEEFLKNLSSLGFHHH